MTALDRVASRPRTAAVLGAILLAELSSPGQVAGVALVAGGIALATGVLGRIRAALAVRGSAA